MGLIKTSSSLNDFFHEEVLKSMIKLNLNCEQESLLYVGEMLANFDDKNYQKPLVVIVANALNMTDMDKAANELKDVGDTCLFISGFSDGVLNKHMKDKDYSISLGIAAYNYAASCYIFQNKEKMYDSLVNVVNDFKGLSRIIEDVFLNSSFINYSKEELIQKLKGFF